MSRHPSPLRTIPLVIALQVAGLVWSGAALAQPRAASVVIDIPAQPASTALKRLIELTGLQLLYSPEVLVGVKSNAVKEAASPRQALSLMFKGTDVQVVDSGDNAVTLTRANGVTALEMVIVTSTKRPSSSKDVAGSVTALNGDELQQRGAVGYEEYLRQAPGVQFNKSDAGYSSLSVRGLSTTTGVATTQGTTGVYLEDVPFTDPFSVIALPDLGAFDLERVEVLRGPQGVLFGSASLGGALRFVLKKPNLYDNEAAVQVTGSRTAGGGTNYGLSAVGNLASASHDFGLRAVIYDRDDSGYIKNTATEQERVNETHQRGGRLLGSWKPTSDLSVLGTLMTERTKIDDSSAVTDPDAMTTNVASRQPRIITTDFANLQVNYDFGEARLTSNTGFIKKNADVQTDLGRALGALLGNLVPVLGATAGNTAQAFSQELRIANKTPSSLNWMGGLFYQRFRQNFTGAFGGNGVTAAANTLYGGMLTPALVNSLTAGDTFYTQDISSLAKESAVFGEVEWRFAERWTATGGARAYRTEMTQDSNTSGLLNFFSLGAAASKTVQSTKDSGVTPKLSLKYTASNGDVWYALASKGYRFGGVNIIPPAQGQASPTAFKSDNLWNYETGLRFAALDRKVFVDLTVFYMDWKNAQINVARADGFGYVDNVGKARSLGMEAAVRYRPTTNLTLSTSAAYIDAVTKADAASAPSGSRLPGTAHLQTFADATLRFAGPMASNGSASLSYSHMGRYFNDLQRTAELGGYGIADLNVRFGFESYEVTLFARNLTNEKGKVGAVAAPGLPYTDWYLTKPRTVGITLRADF